MISEFSEIRDFIIKEVDGFGYEIAYEAFRDMEKIDYRPLAEIKPREENFLKFRLSTSIINVHRTLYVDEESAKMTPIFEPEMKAALLLFGSVVQIASEEQISIDTKEIIKSICPYC